MAFSKLKKASGDHPQVVTLIIDDSGSMQGQKAKEASAALQDLVIQMQANNQGSSTYRFLLNIASFGDLPHPVAVAATPGDVRLDVLTFNGGSGQTNMEAALRWAADAVRQALAVCRGKAGYEEDKAPNPLVVFFSDGANTGNDVTSAAGMLKSIPFKDGGIDVVACGIGMEPQDFPIMQTIASQPDLAANIDPNNLGEYIAVVTTSVLTGKGANEIGAKAREL